MKYEDCNLRKIAALCMLACVSLACHADAPRAQTMAEVLAASKASDWHVLDPANTLYLELASGRVVIELAPAFAPHHVTNILTLTRQKYFDRCTERITQIIALVSHVGDSSNLILDPDLDSYYLMLELIVYFVIRK